MNYKPLLITIFLLPNPAHSELEKEFIQQQEVEHQLGAELQKQKALALNSYEEVLELTNSSNINKDEQIKRLEAADEAWDVFIEKTCDAKYLESIGTRAEHTGILQCRIEKYKEKKIYFDSLI